MITDLLRSLYYLVPRDVRMGLLVRRRSSIWLRSGVVFIHIPKSAGTSINLALYGRFMGHMRACDVENWSSSAVKALPRLAVTRNPWDRLVSAYRFAKRGAGMGGAHQAWVWRPEQYQSPEFETFDRFVREWLSTRDIRGLDGVFQPQSAYICDRNGHLLVDHVGSLDDVEPTLRFVEAKTGRRPELARANCSGQMIDYRSLYTPELVDIVAGIYAEDIDRFGYSFDPR
jgi:hypothetical protein